MPTTLYCRASQVLGRSVHSYDWFELGASERARDYVLGWSLDLYPEQGLPADVRRMLLRRRAYFRGQALETDAMPPEERERSCKGRVFLRTRYYDADAGELERVGREGEAALREILLAAAEKMPFRAWKK